MDGNQTDEDLLVDYRTVGAVAMASSDAVYWSYLGAEHFTAITSVILH